MNRAEFLARLFSPALLLIKKKENPRIRPLPENEYYYIGHYYDDVGPGRVFAMTPDGPRWIKP